MEKAASQREISSFRSRAKVHTYLRKMVGLLRFSGADRRAERVLPEGVLAEGEELSSNPLRAPGDR